MAKSLTRLERRFPKSNQRSFVFLKRYDTRFSEKEEAALEGPGGAGRREGRVGWQGWNLHFFLSEL